MSVKGKRFAFAAAGILAVVLAFRLAVAWRGHPASDLFSWDQAARAEQAVLLAKEARFLEVGRFLRRVATMSWWPPLHALVAWPSVLALGPTAFAMVLPSLAAFVLALLALMYGYSGLFAEAGRGETAGFAFLFGIAATSPLFLSSATWVMLEIFGTGLTFLGYGLYFRARRAGLTRDYRLCGLAFFALWLTKYYYGMVFGLTLLVFEAARLRPLFRRIRMRKLLRALAHPAFLPVYLLIALIVRIGAAGGGTITLFGLHASASGIYNPVAYLYLYILGVSIFFALGHRRRLLGSLEPGQAALLVWGVLPASLFLALPDKIKAVIMNLEAGRRVPPPSFGARGSFYLKSFLDDHALFLGLGVVILVLALAAALRPRRTPLGVRVLAVHGLFGAISMVLGFNLMEGRYIATFVPAVWIIAAWSLASLAGRWPAGVRTALAGMLAVLAAGSILFYSRPVSRALEQPWAGWAHHGEEVRRPVESLVAMTFGSHRVLLAGARDTGFGPLLAWKVEAGHYRDKDFRRLQEEAGPGGLTTPGFESVLASGTMDRVVLCLVDKGAERSSLKDWIRVLGRSGRMRRLGEARFEGPAAMRVIAFGEPGAELRPARRP